MVLQAENQPLQYPQIQNIFFLDGSPAVMRGYVKKYKSCTCIKEEIDILLWFVMLLGTEMNVLNLKKELMSLSSPPERIKCTVHKLKSFFKNMTEEDMQMVFDLFIKKVQMIIKYSPKRKLRQDVILFKAEKRLNLSVSISESLDLDKVLNLHNSASLLDFVGKNLPFRPERNQEEFLVESAMSPSQLMYQINNNNQRFRF
ncbi:fatty acid synthase [Trichonephila clavipes]|nr:fatty acid synthase [Trichonephila clavipes]